MSRGVPAGEDAGEPRHAPGRPRKAAPEDDDDLFEGTHGGEERRDGADGRRGSGEVGGASRAGGAASLAALAAGDGADGATPPEGGPPIPGVPRGVPAGEDAGEPRHAPGRPRKAAPEDDDDLF
ncbi:MAG: hypothetical protein MdMp014T_1579 [Treponematales bacterium]